MGVRLALALAALLLAGCAQGHCRRKVEPPAEVKPLEATGPARADVLRPKDHVLVYKYDGQVQCEKVGGIPIAQMAKELKGIPIFASDKRNDKLAHIASCGSGTGDANVFEIPAGFLRRAEAIGFRRWTFED